jgi:hypothetical protein
LNLVIIIAVSIPSEDELITGIYGRRDEDSYIGSLSFAIFQGSNSKIVTYGETLSADTDENLSKVDSGPYGSPLNPAQAFGIFGTIVAIAGTAIDKSTRMSIISLLCMILC